MRFLHLRPTEPVTSFAVVDSNVYPFAFVSWWKGNVVSPQSMDRIRRELRDSSLIFTYVGYGTDPAADVDLPSRVRRGRNQPNGVSTEIRALLVLRPPLGESFVQRFPGTELFELPQEDDPTYRWQCIRIPATVPGVVTKDDTRPATRPKVLDLTEIANGSFPIDQPFRIFEESFRPPPPHALGYREGQTFHPPKPQAAGEVVIATTKPVDAVTLWLRENNVTGVEMVPTEHVVPV